MTTQNSQILIVGGGVIGMLTARELTLRGADVLLLERGEPGRESSWAGGGILSPLYPWRYPAAVNQLAFHSQTLYPALCDELREQTGIDPEWLPSGLLIDTGDEHETAVSWAKRHSLEYETPSPNEIRELEPALATAPSMALWLPGIAQARNPRLTRALRAELERLKIPVRSRTPVLELCETHGRISGARTPEGVVSASRVVVCAGSWSSQLVDSLPVYPVRGQMILFRAPRDAIRHIYLSKDRYAIPRRDGRVLFGSTTEEDGYAKTTSEAARDELAHIARARYPLLRNCPIEHHWAGLRPGTRNGVPFIGEHPSLSGLFIDSGHYRNGLVLAPASVELCADLIESNPPRFDPTPYRIPATQGRVI